ncbi:general substrate transporter [Artomyces pyxidatus]|uniref:General substrate transporter n=1 Tax=Artomyces pyxidatus TaxID=48021 RepID=A0ACB8T7U0_9AGAM|nr:general substrate transporter [Artomyces pyxidatus]
MVLLDRAYRQYFLHRPSCRRCRQPQNTSAVTTVTAWPLELTFPGYGRSANQRRFRPSSLCRAYKARGLTLNLSPLQNSRVYWLACVVYWGVFLIGYDSGIAGGVISSIYFQTEFDIIPVSGIPDQRHIDSVSSNIVSALQCGAVLGALTSAPVSAQMGRRYTLLAYICISLLGATLLTSAGGSHGLDYIYAGRFIEGIGLGALSAVAPAYVSECAPRDVRGRITGMFQIMLAIGLTIAYFVNYGISLHVHNSSKIWRLSFGFEIVPGGLMILGLLTVRESPRWLASKGRSKEALEILAYLRGVNQDSWSVRSELAEIEATLSEEREARKNLGLKNAFIGKGNFNSINNYTPQTFKLIGYTSVTGSLLASALYGVVKLTATSIFVLYFIDSFGRKVSFFVSAVGMSTSLFILAALLKTSPFVYVDSNPPVASKAMAIMLYLYECFYSMGWGPLATVYVSDIFPNRTRHYGLATASASKWLWNFVISQITPRMMTELGYKMFLLFATLNIGALAIFSLLIPETKGYSLEEMDIIFGSVTADQRRANIENYEKESGHHREESSTGTALDSTSSIV